MFDFPWLRQGSADGRKKLLSEDRPWHERYRSALGWPLVVAVGFWAVASLIIATGNEPLPYSVGQELTRPVYSRVAFERVSEFQTEQARRRARQDVPNYFRFNRDVVERIKGEIQKLHAAAKAAESIEEFRTKHGARWEIDATTFIALKENAQDSEKLARDLGNLEKDLKEQPLVEKFDVGRKVDSTAGHAMLETAPGQFRTVPQEQLDYAANSDHVANLSNIAVRNIFPSETQAIVAAVIRKTIVPEEGRFEPLYKYDAELTGKRIAEADQIPPVMDPFKVGDLIATTGVIGEETFAKLRAEHEEFLAQRQTNPRLVNEWRKRRFGLMGIIALTTIGLGIFTARSQPRVAQKTLRALGIAGLLVGMLAIDRFVLLNVGKSPMWSVTTITLTAAILTITYSQIFALGTVSALALLTVLTLDAPYGLMILLLTVATVTVLMLSEIRTRMHMLRVGIVAGTAAWLAAAFTAFAEGGPVLSEAFLAAIAALIGVCIVFVLLPVIERSFRVSTSLTLLEWADTSKPLLRELIEKAPGTWQHSHLLGSMAETAAQAIGANGLLVRVGAYYHDVGKTCKPAYFIENQDANISAHRGLAPSMSLLVILSHVKDGLALAREHGVPPILHQFIAEHHGTTVVRYFHHMASEEAKASGLKMREVSDTDFRYPGPRPRTRESAILMLCDGVEGAVRSLPEPTPGRIETVVHDILMARLMDGQFDECDITLRELALVERSLVKSLRAIHHGRIAYPKDSTESSRAKVKSA